MSAASRILNPALRSKIMSAEEAAALIPSGVNVGMSGFTGAGYPKAVPSALAKRIMDANLNGHKFRIGVWTGASRGLAGNRAKSSKKPLSELFLKRKFLGR